MFSAVLPNFVLALRSTETFSKHLNMHSSLNFKLLFILNKFEFLQVLVLLIDFEFLQYCWHVIFLELLQTFRGPKISFIMMGCVLANRVRYNILKDGLCPC